MGIYLKYDEWDGKWYWEGYGFRKYYNSKEEAEADKSNVWKQHCEGIALW